MFFKKKVVDKRVGKWYNRKRMAKRRKSLIMRFIPFYRPYVGVLTLDLLCALLFALSGLAFPILVRYLLNTCLSGESVAWEPILVIAAIMLGMKLIETACRYFMITVGHIMGAKLEADMRSALYDKLLYLPAKFYDERKVGDLMSRVNNDLFEITEFSHHCPEELFIAGVKLIGIFIYLATINVYLTLIIFALLPFMVAFAVVFNKRLGESFKRTRKQVGEINTHLEDSLSGMSVVRSFANEDVERRNFERENKKFIAVKRRNYKNLGAFHSGITLATGILYILTIVAGTLFIHNGGITTVDLIAYILYVSTLLTTVEVIMNYTEQFQSGMSGFRRFVEIIDEPVVIESPATSQSTDYGGEIVFRDVSFRYESGTADVLHGVNLTVAPGEHIAFVGPSGAGKTTIANLIPRFYDIDEGSLTIGGVDVRQLDLHELRSHIGVVQQNVYLFNGTVRDNILYGKPDATDEEIVTAAKLAGAHEFISALPNGYDTDCGERGVKLSGGQKQRISIARLFLKNPPILILDEATSALDNESEKLVQKSLESLSAGRTTITIAHRLTTVQHAACIYVVTQDGIVESGTHEQLMARQGLYCALYESALQ